MPSFQTDVHPPRPLHPPPLEQIKILFFFSETNLNKTTYFGNAGVSVFCPLGIDWVRSDYKKGGIGPYKDNKESIVNRRVESAGSTSHVDQSIVAVYKGAIITSFSSDV